MTTENYIDKPLWDAARWRRIAFLVTEDLDAQPGIGLCFEDIAAGRSIFEGWRERFGGPADRAERLRVSIVSGRHPDGRVGFTMSLGTDLDPMPGQPLPARPQTVEAAQRWRFQLAEEPHQSLDWFQASFRRHGMFFLVPLELAAVESGRLVLDFSVCVGKTRLHLRTVGEVLAGGPDDLDAVAVGRV